MTDLQPKTLEQKIREAGDARHVLDNPLFQAAKVELYEKIRQARKQAPISAADLHMKLIVMEQLADQFFDYFELVLQSGKLAQHELDQDNAQQSLRNRGLAFFRTIGRNSL